MPGGALPSGTDWNLFLNRLIYNLYVSKENPNLSKEMSKDSLEIFQTRSEGHLLMQLVLVFILIVQMILIV